VKFSYVYLVIRDYNDCNDYRYAIKTCNHANGKTHKETAESARENEVGVSVDTSCSYKIYNQLCR